MGVAENIRRIQDEVGDAVIVAVSKYSEDDEVQEAYDAGHRDFGENKAQDLDARRHRFPPDVRWHFIGHLQRNKVKHIAPYVHLIHGVDSEKLLVEINKQGKRNNRVIDCLLQIHIAEESAKFGLSPEEAVDITRSEKAAGLEYIRVVGLMGMATNTTDEAKVGAEFEGLAELFRRLKSAELPGNMRMEILSMGMTQDYPLAIEHGSNMVRIGSAIFTQKLRKN